MARPSLHVILALPRLGHKARAADAVFPLPLFCHRCCHCSTAHCSCHRASSSRINYVNHSGLSPRTSSASSRFLSPPMVPTPLPPSSPAERHRDSLHRRQSSPVSVLLHCLERWLHLVIRLLIHHLIFLVEVLSHQNAIAALWADRRRRPHAGSPTFSPPLVLLACALDPGWAPDDRGAFGFTSTGL
jgi:hypothetical protein